MNKTSIWILKGKNLIGLNKLCNPLKNYSIEMSLN